MITDIMSLKPCANFFGASSLADKNNLFDSPSIGSLRNGPSHTSRSRIFWCSYLASLTVAILVVAIWLVVEFQAAGSTRTRPPDVLEVLFLVLTTLPSVLTCLCFCISYCSFASMDWSRKLWPAILFGAISGLIFNAMNAITLIEYLFDW